MRSRRPGCWEIRIVIGLDFTGKSIQRSFVFYGTEEEALAERRRLAREQGRPRGRVGQEMTVGDIFERWFHAPHYWKPSTTVSYRSNVNILQKDPFSGLAMRHLSPNYFDSIIDGWRKDGVTVAVISSRYRTIRASISWAARKQLINFDPLRGMKGPPKPAKRKHIHPDTVKLLVQSADRLLREARAAQKRSKNQSEALRKAEELALLVRLAAETGARRGELAALKFQDLQDRVLTIERGISHKTVTSTKTGEIRRITISESTVTLWNEVRRRRGLGPNRDGWLFAGRLDPTLPSMPATLAKRFAAHCENLGVTAHLHRLRHTVGTVLVSQGKLLKAQSRLGHDDPVTTLRTYAHATPLEDEDVSEDFETLFGMTG